MVDTHAHLAMRQQFSPESIPAVLERAWEAGLAAVVVPAGGPSEFESITRMARDHAGVAGMLGYHPEHAGEVRPGEVDALRPLLQAPGIVGIGEAGIDFYWKDDVATRAAQRALCTAQLELAGGLDFPVSLHLRDKDGRGDAAEALMELLRAHPARAIIHSCTAPADTVRELLALGCWISFSGIATFPNADLVREAAKAVPLDRLLVETDAPFLTPVPVRGKTNEPAYVRHTTALLARERGEDPEMLWRAVGENARALLRLGAEGRTWSEAATLE